MRIIILVLFVCVAPEVLARDYDDVFGSVARKAYSEDINVWVYTSEFADRFGMPVRWVDSELKGAYAIAYRVEVSSARLMFPHKGPDVSMPQRYCVLDIYVDDKENIPWMNDWPADFKTHPTRSPYYLYPQSLADLKWKTRAVGLPEVLGIVSYGTGRQNLGGFPLHSYKKSIYPGVTYMSFSMGCVTPPKTASWIEFHDYSPREPSGQVSRRVLPEVLHRIDIPSAFMLRLYEKWYSESRSAAQREWRDVITR